MISSIKAEFRKLLTVRSTYVLAAICLAFMVLISFYALGYKASATALAQNPDALRNAVTTSLSIITLFVALVGVLLVTHEYRYNTVMYTLTAARRRWHMLVSKTIVATVFAIIVAALVVLLAPLLMKLGLHVHQISSAGQHIDYGDLLLKAIFYTWGFMMYGLIIAFLVRSQVGGIVTLLVFPAVVENLLSLLLKAKSIYLPFTALGTIFREGPTPPHALSVSHSVLVVLAYIVVGWLVALALLHKRDAN